MADRWYVLSCALRKERLIYHQLHERGFEVYYPYLITKTQKPNMLKIEPYFPGYMFIKVDLEQVAPSIFQWMPMTEGLVSAAEKPVYVPNRIIQAIHRNLWKINSAVLGIPDEMIGSHHQSGDDDPAGNGGLFDQQISGADRSLRLFHYLQFVSQPID